MKAISNLPLAGVFEPLLVTAATIVRQAENPRFALTSPAFSPRAFSPQQSVKAALA
jgi:hypothetical protein